jgi:hypothetical protein
MTPSVKYQDKPVSNESFRRLTHCDTPACKHVEPATLAHEPMVGPGGWMLPLNNAGKVGPGEVWCQRIEGVEVIEVVACKTRKQIAIRTRAVVQHRIK